MDNLYIGVDVSKNSHMVALVSTGLLKAHRMKHDACPTRPFENSRAGFENLLSFLAVYADPAHCRVLLERTGHYGAALEQYLQERNILVYRMQARKRYGKNKTDKKDAQALAVMLYNQVELRTPVVDEKDRVFPVAVPLPEARALRGMVKHRAELITERVQRENKLTSISDELFPEMSNFFSDMNCPTALRLREQFPTPQALALASLEELQMCRMRNQPSTAKLLELQEAARTTIGIKDEQRKLTLLLEQRQLLAEHRLLTAHIEELEQRIISIVNESRAGRILASFVGVSPIQAAALLAWIGHIDNFENDLRFRSYLGWSPRRSQTGTSYDSVTLDRGGNGFLKHTMFFITMNAIKHDPTWRSLFERLAKKDERTGKYTNRKKVYGRVAGQMAGIMYLLLKKDAELVASWEGPGPLPEPELYHVLKHARTIGGI